MLDALSQDRKTRYTLASTPGAVQVDALEARRLAKAGELVCGDPHCDATIHYNGGSSTRRAYWYHGADAPEWCAERETGEGEWHRWVCRDVFGAALVHEHSMPGARADVVVRATRAGAMVAVEAQHSAIDEATVRRRNEAHRSAGMSSTLWIVDGRVALPGIEDDPQWSDAEVIHINRGSYGGVPAVMIDKAWVADVVRACAATPWSTEYACTVGFLVGGPDGRPVLRFVDRAEVHDVDGRVSVVVTEWSKPVTDQAIRAWSGDDSVARDVSWAVMQAARQRSVELANRSYAVAVQPETSLVRIGFGEHHTDHREAGVSLGLEWRRRHDPFPNGDPAGVGHLIGPLTPDVRTWMSEVGIALPVAA